MSVSDRTEQLVMKLVAWEVMGVEGDPKEILRQVPLADLAEMHTNLSTSDEEPETLSELLVTVEMLYRNGHLEGDWEVVRENEKLTLKYRMINRYTCRSLPTLLLA